MRHTYELMPVHNGRHLTAEAHEALSTYHDELRAAESEETFSLEEVKEALYYVLSKLKGSNCSAMLLDCMCLSIGMGTYYNENGQVLADKHGVSRQRIHKVKDEIHEAMGVVGDAFAKREGAKETYRLTNKRNTKCTN